MYKIIIVDDEINAIEGLKILIDAERVNISEILTSTNAIEGLQIIEKERPDIIISDISMPQMNGLEMIAAIKKIPSYNPMIVILSGYSTFSYAQTAMSHGVKAYLLKPVDEDELNDKLDELIGEIEAGKQNAFEKNVVIEGTLLKILNGDKSSKSLSAFETLLGVKKSDKLLLGSFSLSYKSNREIELSDEEHDANFEKVREIFSAVFAEKYQLKTVMPSSDKMLSILFAEKIDEKEVIELHKTAAKIASDELDILINSSLYSSIISMAELPQSLISLVKKAPRAAELVEEEMSSSEDFKLVNEAFSVIASNFDTMFNSELDESLESVFDLAISHNMPISQFSSIYSAFVINISKFLSGVYENLPETIKKASAPVDGASSLSSIKADAIGIILEISKDMSDYNNKLQNETFHNIITYVNNNFTENLTLKSLATKFYVNPIYLGRVFKKNMGTLFNEYLTTLRIEKSKVLLKKTNKKIYEIAADIGFNDPNYFIAKFLKSEGVTPSQFRKN